MTATLIVLAHPDRGSFNAAWADSTAAAARTLGHEVLWSDLHAMGFDPVERRAHYPDVAPGPFDVLKAQEAAAASGTLPPDVSVEMAKIRRADRIVFHFPVWWFAPPAMLKGWCERVLAHGALHSTSARFDTGLCRGKKALVCATTGSKATESATDGKEGNIAMLLWPFAYTLRYLGLTVLEPRVVHGVHGYHSGAAREALSGRLRETLAAQARTMAEFDALPAIQFNADTDFTSEGALRPEAPSHSAFIRHRAGPAPAR